MRSVADSCLATVLAFHCNHLHTYTHLFMYLHTRNVCSKAHFSIHEAWDCQAWLSGIEFSIRVLKGRLGRVGIFMASCARCMSESSDDPFLASLGCMRMLPELRQNCFVAGQSLSRASPLLRQVGTKPNSSPLSEHLQSYFWLKCFQIAYRTGKCSLGILLILTARSLAAAELNPGSSMECRQLTGLDNAPAMPELFINPESYSETLLRTHAANWVRVLAR